MHAHIKSLALWPPVVSELQNDVHFFVVRYTANSHVNDITFVDIDEKLLRI